MKWKYCPECGCRETVNENLYGEGSRQCKECNQEWWENIDYTDTVSVVLKNFKKQVSFLKEEAILFAEWCDDTYERGGFGSWVNRRVDEPDGYDTKQLYEIYKQTKK